MNPRHASRAGFSLIEILIAIIILALGLLGLGAVFPVVIREQRIAQDRILGTVAADNIRAILNGFAGLNRKIEYLPIDPSTLTGDALREWESGARATAVCSGWATLQEEWNYYQELAMPTGIAGRVDFSRAFDFSREGLWEPYWSAWPNAQAPNAYGQYLLTGAIVLSEEDASAPGLAEAFPPAKIEQLRADLVRRGLQPVLTFQRQFLPFRIPISARLNPTGDADDNNPSYVWDFIARRKLESPDPRTLQVAVFVRRVDPKLRPIPRVPPIAGNDTISVREQILNGTLGSRDRLPVGEDGVGVPTLDGTGGAGGTLNYSGVHQVNVVFTPDPQDPLLRKRDQVLITGATGADYALIRQRGQRVIDNLGNTYTVVDFTGPYLRIDPPVAPSVLATDPNPLLASIRQLIFTPQIPVLTFVMEVEP